MTRRKIDDPAQAAGVCFNMTPMIDVTFQLIVVFLCSMKFRTLDQKIEAFLPKGVGVRPDPSAPDTSAKVDLRLRRRPGEGTTRLSVLGNPVDSFAAMEARLREIRGRDPAVKARIDADPDVPHAEVMAALDSCAAAAVAEVTFRGTGPMTKR